MNGKSGSLERQGGRNLCEERGWAVQSLDQLPSRLLHSCPAHTHPQHSCSQRLERMEQIKAEALDMKEETRRESRTPGRQEWLWVDRRKVDTCAHFQH